MKEEKEKRMERTKQRFRFFGTSAAIIAYCDKSLSEEHSMYDRGAVVQTISLVALNYGLGTCMQGQGILFPDVIRKHTNIPEFKSLIICATMGYPDTDFPANKLVTERVHAGEITQWFGFE